MLGLAFSSKLDWGSYIISTAKTVSKKIGALIHSMKFLSPEVALYLYKPTTHPCMGYCCHIWAGAPSCQLELLDKLQKRICRTVGPSFAASLELLAHCWRPAQVFSQVLLWQMFFKTSSTGSTSFSLGRLCDFSVTIPRCYKVVSWVKGQKMAQNDKKFCVTHQIYGTIYHMIVIYVTLV